MQKNQHHSAITSGDVADKLITKRFDWLKMAQK